MRFGITSAVIPYDELITKFIDFFACDMQMVGLQGFLLFMMD